MSAEHKKIVENPDAENNSEEINIDTNQEISNTQEESKLQLIDTIKEKHHFNRQQLDKVLKNRYSPENLIKLFELSYQKEFNSSAGVTEGHTIKKHTLMVMNQFEKYFKDKELPGNLNPNFFRVILALHDIGKPQAISEGDKRNQHIHTERMIKEFLSDMDFSEKEIKIATALISKDPIGKYFKSGNLDRSKNEIIEMAQAAEMELEEFYELLIVFYKCDASSYTRDAGGIASLDEIFNFDHTNKELDFSDDYLDKIDELEDEILEAADEKAKSTNNKIETKDIEYNYNGKTLQITSAKTTEILKTHYEDFKDTKGFAKQDLMNEAIYCLEEIIQEGIHPVFTVPREYIDTTLKQGLIPRPSSHDKKIKALVGTIGRAPYQGDQNTTGRYIAILKNPQKFKDFNIKPRFTGPKNLFRGIIATTNKIHINELIIIDSKDKSIIHPKTDQ